MAFFRPKAGHRPQRSRRTHNRPKDRENLPAAVRKYDRTKYLPNRLHFSGMHSIFASRIQKAGCSSVRLECWSGGPKVAGSSPVIPTKEAIAMRLPLFYFPVFTCVINTLLAAGRPRRGSPPTRPLHTKKCRQKISACTFRTRSRI